MPVHLHRFLATIGLGSLIGAAVCIAPVNLQAGGLRKFDLVDVAAVTKTSHSRPEVADAGFDVYVVTLKAGDRREVRVSHGPMTRDMVIERFRAVGFVGDVEALRSMAVAKPASAPGK